MNKDNLAKLLKTLKSKKKLPLKFDMATWHEHTSCGSVGCLIGLSTHIIEPIKGGFGYDSEAWSTYSKRIYDLKPWDNMWRFLFDSAWGRNKKTNTKAHAIKRIEYVLKNDDVPFRWNYDWGTT